jgi:hypothetical protein
LQVLLAQQNCPNVPHGLQSPALHTKPAPLHVSPGQQMLPGSPHRSQMKPRELHVNPSLHRSSPQHASSSSPQAVQTSALHVRSSLTQSGLPTLWQQLVSSRPHATQIVSGLPCTIGRHSALSPQNLGASEQNSGKFGSGQLRQVGVWQSLQHGWSWAPQGSHVLVEGLQSDSPSRQAAKQHPSPSEPHGVQSSTWSPNSTVKISDVPLQQGPSAAESPFGMHGRQTKSLVQKRPPPHVPSSQQGSSRAPQCGTQKWS